MASTANPAKAMFRHARALGRAAGLEVTPLRNVEQRVVGIEVRVANKQPNGNTKGEIVTSTHEGQPVSFFVANEADVIQSQHHRGLFYEREELEIIKRHFRGGVFLDVGANVGNHSLYALKFLNASRVIAVEPNPDAYNILRVNIALNDVSDRFAHHAVGFSDNERTAGMRRFQDNLGGTRLTEDGDELRVVTGDSLVADEPVAFIKVDVEGMELGVLRGLEQTIAKRKPPIFVEVLDRNEAELLAWAEAQGYQQAETYSRYEYAPNVLLLPRHGHRLVDAAVLGDSSALVPEGGVYRPVHGTDTKPAAE